jgi:hypothetical protein
MSSLPPSSPLMRFCLWLKVVAERIRFSLRYLYKRWCTPFYLCIELYLPPPRPHPRLLAMPVCWLRGHQYSTIISSDHLDYCHRCRQEIFGRVRLDEMEVASPNQDNLSTAELPRHVRHQDDVT